MPDHALEEQPVELGPARLVERGHLLVGHHARHQHLVLHAVHLHLVPRGRGVGHGPAPVAQPLLHRRDLVALPDDDPFAQDRDVLTGAVGRRPARHDDRLRVMRNHAGHELDVGVAVRKLPEAGRGLMDRGGCLRLSAGAGGERQAEPETRPGDHGTHG